MRPSIRYIAMSLALLALAACLYGTPSAFAQKISQAPDTKESLNRVQEEGQLFVSAQDSNGATNGAVAPTAARSVSNKGRQIVSAPQSFSNTTPITITDCPSPCPASGQAASVYPSTIVVAGVTTPTVQRVSVTLNGFTHSFPSDVDMLLVSPSGRAVVIMSDFGAGAPGITNGNVTLDDYAQVPVPSTATGNTGYPFVTGSYRPSNSGTTDVFPAPAPAAPYQYSLSQFNGDNPNGTWSLYIIDDANLDGGSISGGYTLTFDTRPAPPAAGDILVSEFRTRGAGTAPPTSDGSADEFIELYNNTDSSITIIDSVPGADPTLAAGAGWRFAVAQGAAETTFLVLPQTLSTAGPLALPARGHFLISTQPTTPSPAGNTYSLATYPTGTGFTASGAANISLNPASATTGFLPDDGGLGIFNSATASAATRLDSVGFSSVTNPLYKEGTGLAPATGITTAGQHSFVRKYSINDPGYPVDTNNNANDFVLVETTGAILNGVQSTLGAPGPERGPTATAYTTSAAPRIRPNAQLTTSLIDPAAGGATAPNRERNFTAVTNGPLGTLAIRRCFTNNTGAPILTMRYRVTDITTLGNTTPAQADLRVLASAAQTITVTGGGTVNSLANTVQTPPAQAVGGGLNTSLGQTGVTTTAPLANAASLCTTFTLGVQRAGQFRFFISPESLNALP